MDIKIRHGVRPEESLAKASRDLCGVSLGKLGLLGGAVGVTTHYGVWGNTEQGVNAYEQLQDLVEPYTPEELSQVKSMTTSAFNSRLESSPRSSGASKNSPSTFTEVYNKGVQKTFEFMVNSPGMVSGSMNNLTNTVKEQFKEK